MAQRVAHHHEARIERDHMTYEEYLAWTGGDISAELVNGKSNGLGGR